MKYQSIIIEKSEHKKIKNYLENAHYENDQIFKNSIGSLLNELKKAKVVDEKDLPNDVVRFYSKVTIKTPFSKSITYQIVSPEEKNISENKISILSPMALALFGYAQNDTVEWEFPNGKNLIEIIDVSN